MTPEEIAELKQLAEEAQKDVQVNGWYSARAFRDALAYQAGTPFEAEYLAAADPATILRLIAHVEELDARLSAVREERKRARDHGLRLQARIDRALSPACIDYGHMDIALERVREALSAPNEGDSDE